MDKSCLVSFWQKSSLLETGESFVCPQTCVSSSIVETSNDSLLESISFSQLFQVVFSDETWSCVEESQARKYALDVAGCDTFLSEDSFSVLSHSGCWNSEFQNAFLTGFVKIFPRFNNVFCRSLWRKKKITDKICFLGKKIPYLWRRFKIIHQWNK